MKRSKKNIPKSSVFYKINTKSTAIIQMYKIKPEMILRIHPLNCWDPLELMPFYSQANVYTNRRLMNQTQIIGRKLGTKDIFHLAFAFYIGDMSILYRHYYFLFQFLVAFQMIRKNISKMNSRFITA